MTMVSSSFQEEYTTMFTNICIHKNLIVGEKNSGTLFDHPFYADHLSMQQETLPQSRIPQIDFLVLVPI